MRRGLTGRLPIRSQEDVSHGYVLNSYEKTDVRIRKAVLAYRKANATDRLRQLQFADEDRSFHWFCVHSKNLIALCAVPQDMLSTFLDPSQPRSGGLK